MSHLDALVGIVVLMALSLWVVGKAGGGPPIIAHILHPARRDRPTGNEDLPRGVEEDDDVRWHWPSS